MHHYSPRRWIVILGYTEVFITIVLKCRLSGSAYSQYPAGYGFVLFFGHRHYNAPALYVGLRQAVECNCIVDGASGFDRCSWIYSHILCSAATVTNLVEDHLPTPLLGVVWTKSYPPAEEWLLFESSFVAPFCLQLVGNYNILLVNCETV